MGQLVKMGPSDIEIKRPSDETQRIVTLINKAEADRVELSTALEDKLKVISQARADQALNPGDRGPKIVAGRAHNAIEKWQVKLSEIDSLLAGLEIRQRDAERAEKERLFRKLESQIKEDGLHLLELVTKLQANIVERNQLLSEVDTIMCRTFWDNRIADVNKYFGMFVMLPTRLDKVDDPFSRPCSFLEKLGILVESDEPTEKT